MNEIYCPKECPYLLTKDRPYCSQYSKTNELLYANIELPTAFVCYADNDGTRHEFKVAVYLPHICLHNPVSIKKIIKEKNEL